jgi:hypothetical protein
MMTQIITSIALTAKWQIKQQTELRVEIEAEEKLLC